MATIGGNSRKAREAALDAKVRKMCQHQKITSDTEALQILADYAVDEVQLQRTKLANRRRARTYFGRSGNALQKFMSTLSEFVKVYSGLTEVAKGIDTQCGGLVAGSLSVLAQVGENKEGRENAINRIFEELTKSWIGSAGRLGLYAEAYSTSPRMEAFLADVYLGIGELAIESAEYYSRPPYVRLWQAIRRPPKLGIDLKADEIKKGIFEVVSEGTALLIEAHARQDQVWKAKWAQQQRDQVVHMERRLGLNKEQADPDTMIRHCKALHEDAFTKAIRKKGAKQLQQISLGLLENFHLYDSSDRTAKSSVLVLTGSNFDLYWSGHGLCWLSPVTTEIAEMFRSKMREKGQSRFLFHSACSDEESRFRKEKEPFDVCLSQFIMQVLLWGNEYFSEYRQIVEDDIGDNNRQRSETLASLLEGLHGLDEVGIIIDRLDRIAPPDGHGASDDDEVSDLLERILKIVSTASCKIKLIVTVDASGWPQVRKDADLEERWNIWKRSINLQKFSPYYKVDWQQPELPQW